MYQKLELKDLVSGQTLRKYRHRLAGFSRAQDSVLTTKFRLDCPASTARSFAVFQELYDVVEGEKKGSLAYFLFSVILSGFRLFASSSGASLFATHHFYDEKAFGDALEGTVGTRLPGMTIEAICKRLKTAVRSTKGKNNQFVPEVIEREYRQTLLGKKLPEGGNQQIVDAIFKEFAEKLVADGFDSWSSVNADLKKALHVLDEVLHKYGTFPSLSAMQTKADEIPSLPSNSTIVFDSSVPMCHMESLGDAVPYAVVATILHYPECADRTRARDHVKEHLTTSKASGLSWLFNKGLTLFKTKSVEELCRLYSVPLEESCRVEQIVEAAKAIPEQDLLMISSGPMSYHNLRTSFAGRIDSWTSNYINRLEELRSILSAVGLSLTVPQLKADKGDFWAEIDCQRDEVELLCQTFADLRPQVTDALEHLLGNGSHQVTKDVEVVEKFTRVMNRLQAIRSSIENSIVQHEDNQQSVWKEELVAFKTEIAAWNSLVRLPKLNGMRNGVPKVQSELQEAGALFDRTTKAMESHFASICRWLSEEKISVNVVEHFISSEPSAKKNASVDREPGIRKLLQKLTKLVRDRRDECADDMREWFRTEGIFAHQKNFNQFFYNRLGALSVSTYARGRHQPYPLGSRVISRAEDIWTSFQGFVLGRKDRYPRESESAETYRRLLAMYYSTTIVSIDKPIPKDVAKLHLPEEDLSEVMHEGLRLQLNAETVTASVLAKAFNLYTSLISGAMILLRRERFYLRTKFCWVGNTVLKYVPKMKAWALPKERYASSSLWQTIFNLNVLVTDEDGKINTVETFQKAVAHLGDEDKLPALRELFHQLPHDWYYDLPFSRQTSGEESASVTSALCVKKAGAHETVLSKSTVDLLMAGRMVGPCSMKERLDALLLDPKVVTGDITLLVNQEYRQNKMNVTSTKMTLEVALPMTTPTAVQTAEKSPFKRIVSIDQGERGLAFAVFELNQAGKSEAVPLTTGVVRIPSIRHLIKTVKRYRRGKQAVQKFNQRYDSTMFTLKENVAGDVCGAIAGLMSRYQAFPVLEIQVSNLASGSRQLGQVYKMVNARFLYDNVQAHETERSAWWYGAKSWTMPQFNRRIMKQTDDGMVTDKKRLTVFPGLGVDAKWTSRICSHCGRNISALIAHLEQQDKSRKIQLDENGEAIIEGQTIKLYCRPDGDAAKKARRRNERASWVQPLSNRSLSLKEFRRVVMENLRRAPKSLQTRDTTQSRYFCVFKDCEWHNRERHADVNAAINIGRRCLESLEAI